MNSDMSDNNIQKNLENSNFNFSKYSPIRNKYGLHWIQSLGPIRDLF